MDLIEIWPIMGLRIRTPRLELRAMDQELAVALAALAAEGIHDPATMPFIEPWTDTASPDLERESMRHHWRMWANVRPEEWAISFAVIADGEVQGLQNVHTSDFARMRTFDTGSWLGRRFHGRGVGTEMRAAVLHLMFAELGAVEATTGAFADVSSLGVTRSLGYEPNGAVRKLRRGGPAEELLFRMPRATWAARRRDDITVEGLTAACLAFLGLDGTDAAGTSADSEGSEGSSDGQP